MKKILFFAICVMAVILVGCEPKVTETKPKVATTSVNNIQYNSAVVAGNVINDGGTPVTERGVVYDKYDNPTVLKSPIIKAGSGLGAFKCEMTNLQEDQKYYVRAYAINEVGISYGSVTHFRTSIDYKLPDVFIREITNIKATSVTITGYVRDDGGGYVSERGVAYSTSANPTISNNVVKAAYGTREFKCDLINLQEKTTYYVRAYAINEAGVAYGEEKSFTTKEETLPNVKISSIDNVTYTSASVNVEIIDDGYATITECGVCYSTSQNPTTSDSIVKYNNTTGTFRCDISNLTNATTYYVRAYATNKKGTAYSEQIEFTTKAHAYVDLGLSVKWATYNVGAEKPEQSGDYFSWAGTNVRKEYSIYYDCPYIIFGSYTVYYYKYCTQPSSGSPDNKTTLEPQDDAAHVNWGGNWRMPTYEEWNELKNNCTWTSVTQNGKKGYTITSTSNGNSIFLPAAGYMTDEDLEHADKGYYWSSSLRSYSSANNGTDEYAYILYFSPSAWPREIEMNTMERYRGLPVRAVCP